MSGMCLCETFPKFIIFDSAADSIAILDGFDNRNCSPNQCSQLCHEFCVLLMGGELGGVVSQQGVFLHHFFEMSLDHIAIKMLWLENTSELDALKICYELLTHILRL